MSFKLCPRHHSRPPPTLLLVSIAEICSTSSAQSLQLRVTRLATLALRRMDKQSLGRGPVGSRVGIADANHLELTVDGTAKGAARDRQVRVGVHVAQLDRSVPQPGIARAHHQPVVAGITDALVVTVRGDLLVAGQRTLEVVRVQVLVRRQVVQPDGVATFDRLAVKRK